jgi:adenylate cyclase
VVLGVALSLSPIGFDLEESHGLRVLFRLRGKVAPPPEVVVIALDSVSAKALGLPDQPWKWPRSLHARLVDRLVDGGALAIGFDLVFEDPRPDDQDLTFAQAIENAGNVVLCELLKKEGIPLQDLGGSGLGEASVEKLIGPTKALAEAALARASFPLPKVPMRVSRFWTFKTDAADRPALPVVMFQVYGLQVYDEWMGLIRKSAPHWMSALPPSSHDVVSAKSLENLVVSARSLFLRDPGAAERLMAEVQRAPGRETQSSRTPILESLLRMYAIRGNSLFLNYYGPPGTILTIPYHRVLEGEVAGRGIDSPMDFKGKAVFVGLSELSHPQQMDAFHTVFSQSNGIDICGVEIAATAFANLLEGNWVRPVGPLLRVLLIAIWGALLGALCGRLSTPAVPLAAVSIGLLYFLTALWRFANHAHWLPLVIPVFIQMPFALLASIFLRYRESIQERRNVERALGHYLPPHAVEMLRKNLDLSKGSRVVYGVCLFSDISCFTALSEGFDPSELREFLNRYYHEVFGPVGRHRGIVSDLVGDSMLALWVDSVPGSQMKTNACRAALEILEAVQAFNRDSAPLSLPLRLGIHAGEMVLGTLGARGHYEYRPVGDVVNTASRIEGLNKHLGTTVLATAEVLQELEGFIARELGQFVLVGKRRPVSVFELAGIFGGSAIFPDGFLEKFSEGLSHFRAGSWMKALVKFQDCTAILPGDGPSRFYIEVCRSYMIQEPEGPWRGWVVMTRK